MKRRLLEAVVKPLPSAGGYGLQSALKLRKKGMSKGISKDIGFKYGSELADRPRGGVAAGYKKGFDEPK